MQTLHLDLETYSAVDLAECGVHKYVESETFEILLLAYKIDENPTRVIDLTQTSKIPPKLVQMLEAKNVLKVAHNANFEIACLRRVGVKADRRQWKCTQIMGAYLGLPLQLGKIAEVLRLSEQKDTKGKELIRYFCQPCKPTKTNYGRTRNLPTDDPAKWYAFCNYCKQDVETEHAIYEYACNTLPVPASVWSEWLLDSEIDETGVLVDLDFVNAGIQAFTEAQEETHAKMRKYGVDNPNSASQVKSYLERRTGEPVGSLGKQNVADAIASNFYPEDCTELLKLRLRASNTSVTKLSKILSYVQNDGRIRGQFQFYGANRTGREAGRAVQLQNLKKTYSEPKLGLYRDLVKCGLANDMLADTGEAISKLVRSAFVAGAGRKLVSVDFSAIEARVLAWLAGETWVLDVFKTHGKIYEATASKMFNIPLEEITKGSEYRAKGKVASLALGYQGGVGALITMGALREGLKEEELPAIVSSYRLANPKIVGLWRRVQDSAYTAVKHKKTVILKLDYCKLIFEYSKGYLFITLPSGRKLSYYGARMDSNKLTYWGLDQVKKVWVKMETYGGKLVENITQAVARDLLFNTLGGVNEIMSIQSSLNFYGSPVAKIVMHVHDEIVLEAKQEYAPAVLEMTSKLMSGIPAWAKGLPLKGEGYISDYYKKD